MKKLIYVSFLLFTTSLYSQVTVLAAQEHLSFFILGDSNPNIQYETNEEGFFSPNGPFIDGTGILYFFPTYNQSSLLKYSKGLLERIDLMANRTDYEKLISTSYVFTSQQGTISVSGNGLTFNFYSDEFRSEVFTWGDGKIRANDYILIPVLDGMYLNSISQRVTICAEFEKSGSIRIRDDRETRAWLPTQPGGFTIGDDGLLYRNGMLWSAIKPKTIGGRYVGRLASGHAIWDAGDHLYFVDSRQNIELIIEIPWAYRDSPNRGFENHGIGPWGEIYYLIPPPHVPTGKMLSDNGGGFYKEYDFDKSKPAELVVVRNHLKYFGRLNDDKVRLRKEANTSSAIVGTYPNKTGFRILETGTKKV